MSKATIVCSAAALVAFAAPSLAQPPGITAEMINTTLPLEGAPLAVAGPYQVTSGAIKNAPGLMVFHPANLDAFPSRDTLPVLVVGRTLFCGEHRLPEAAAAFSGRRAAPSTARRTFGG